MKKILLSLVFVAVAICNGFSQSLVLADSTGILQNNTTIVHRGHPSDDEIVSYIFVHNVTGAPLEVKVKKVEINIIAGTMNTFCWGLCFPPTVFVSNDPKTINGNSWDSTDFSGHYTPSGIMGGSTVRYVFFNQTNPTDSVCVNVIYEAWAVGFDNQVAQTALSTAWPNPAGNLINFSFSGNSSSGSLITIRNIVGTVVKRADIEGNNGKLSIVTADLPDGIYFYSLEINGTTVSTKKLVVRH